MPDAATEPDLPPRLRLGAAVDPELDHDLAWHDAEGHPFRSPLLQRAYYRTCDELERALQGFDKECLYFFGHAGIGEDRTPWLQLAGKLLKLRSMARDDGTPTLLFQRNLIVVFLNGCSTAPINALSEGSAVAYLYQDKQNQNRLCCLGSVGEVAAPFAAELARRFWERFFAGAPIGTALHQARVSLMAEHNNPLGLLYALFGEADTRIGNV
jgi:hypothetical protein